MIADWPTGYDVERYADEHGLDFDDITRDIVRIATIAHLLDTGVLNEDFVLTGGMALRLRGSSRFTIKDTDSSLRGRLDELELSGKVRLETDQLQVYPDPGTNWGRKTPKREWQGPLNKAGDSGASLIRFMGPKIGFDEAISLVREHIIPKLFAIDT